MKNTGTTGTNGVDWEARVDFDRLRDERLARVKAELERRPRRRARVRLLQHPLHDRDAHRHVGDGQAHPLQLPTRNTDPISWDFGSAAKHHALYNPWLDVTSSEMDADPHAPPEAPSVRGSSRRAGGHLHPARRLPPEPGSPKRSRARSSASWRSSGSPTSRSASTSSKLPILFARSSRSASGRRRPAGLHGGPAHQDERRDPAAHAGGVDGDAAYEDLYRFLRPGVRENEAVGLVAKTLYDLGSEYVEGVNAISGERCSPHPHVFSDRLIRRATPPSSTSCTAGTATAPATTAPSRRDRRARSKGCLHPVPRIHDRAIALVLPGATTATSSRSGRQRRSFGFADEEAAFALQYVTGSVCRSGRSRSSRGWCRSITRRSSRRAMVFALETYWPSRTAGAPRASRRRSWSPRTAARSSRVPRRRAANRRSPLHRGRRPAEQPARLAVAPEHDVGSREA